jgi:hypothetical protein
MLYFDLPLFKLYSAVEKLTNFGEGISIHLARNYQLALWPTLDLAKAFFGTRPQNEFFFQLLVVSNKIPSLTNCLLADLVVRHGVI